MSSRCVIPLAPLLSCLSGLSSSILRRVPSFSAALSCPQMASCLPSLSCTLSYTGARTHALVCLCGCVCSCGRERVYAHIECLAKKAKLARLRHEQPTCHLNRCMYVCLHPTGLYTKKGGGKTCRAAGLQLGTSPIRPRCRCTKRTNLVRKAALGLPTLRMSVSIANPPWCVAFLSVPLRVRTNAVACVCND